MRVVIYHKFLTKLTRKADRKKCFVSGCPAGPNFFSARTGGTEKLKKKITFPTSICSPNMIFLIKSDSYRKRPPSAKEYPCICMHLSVCECTYVFEAQGIPAYLNLHQKMMLHERKHQCATGFSQNLF